MRVGKGRSDRPEKAFALSKDFCIDLSERTLIVFSRRNPSKLNTRVRFPSPVPMFSIAWAVKKFPF